MATFPALRLDGHSQRLTYILELCTTTLLIEATMWSWGSAQRALFWTAAAWVLVSGLHARDLRPFGFGKAGFVRSLWVVPLVAIACGIAMLLARSAGTLRTLYGTQQPLAHAIGYAIWALFQQFILQSYVFTRMEALAGRRRAVLASAALFSALHVPNVPLILATLLGGLLFCEVFSRWRNIYPLAIAHAMAGLTLAITLPDSVLRHMRVGMGYLTFRIPT